jgi:hypothetical protein
MSKEVKESTQARTPFCRECQILDERCSDCLDKDGLRVERDRYKRLYQQAKPFMLRARAEAAAGARTDVERHIQAWLDEGD